MHDYKITLKSKSENIKWPRYEILLEHNLSYKEATKHTYEALRTAERQGIFLSQFKYDPKTGIVDTRVKRTSF